MPCLSALKGPDHSTIFALVEGLSRAAGGLRRFDHHQQRDPHNGEPTEERPHWIAQ